MKWKEVRDLLLGIFRNSLIRITIHFWTEEKSRSLSKHEVASQTVPHFEPHSGNPTVENESTQPDGGNLPKIVCSWSGPPRSVCSQLVNKSPARSVIPESLTEEAGEPRSGAHEQSGVGEIVQPVMMKSSAWNQTWVAVCWAVLEILSRLCKWSDHKGSARDHRDMPITFFWSCQSGTTRQLRLRNQNCKKSGDELWPPEVLRHFQYKRKWQLSNWRKRMENLFNSNVAAHQCESEPQRRWASFSPSLQLVWWLREWESSAVDSWGSGHLNEKGQSGHQQRWNYTTWYPLVGISWRSFLGWWQVWNGKWRHKDWPIL